MAEESADEGDRLGVGVFPPSELAGPPLVDPLPVEPLPVEAPLPASPAEGDVVGGGLRVTRRSADGVDATPSSLAPWRTATTM